MGYRIDYRGAIHHVFVRGNNKQAIFLDDDDRSFFLGRLKKIRLETSTNLYAAGLMTNHFHLLPETGQTPLKTVMSRLLSPYAMRFNAKYGRVGHVFQGPYGSKPCKDDAYFKRLIRYIHRNPVAAGMVRSPSEWPWSGHHDLLNGTNTMIDSAFPLSLFGATPVDARRAYTQFSGDWSDDGWEPEIDEENPITPGVDLDALLEEIAETHGLDISLLASGKRGKAFTAAKRDFIQRAFENGFSQADIARRLNCSEAAVFYLRET